jgi:hypothetical protein
MSELNEIPGWVENTPQEQAYELSMFDSSPSRPIWPPSAATGSAIFANV